MANSSEMELPPIEFFADGESNAEKQSNLDKVLPSPGFPTLAQLVAEITAKRSSISVLDYTAQAVQVRFKIDGLWHSMPPMDRETGDYMAVSLKQLAGMNYQDRRRRQKGKFQVLFRRQKTGFDVISQGVPTGERIVLETHGEDVDTDDLEACGMRPRMIEQLKSLFAQTDPSLTLVCGIPGEGYTTAWRSVLSAADRLVQDYFVLEEVSRQEPEVINVTPELYDESKGETPLSPIPRLLLREPNVLAFTELNTGTLIDGALEVSVNHELPIITRIPGKSAIDGLLRFLLRKPNPKQTLSMLKAVVCMRVIRKLCTRCRVPFVPNPTLLQQLGIPAGRVRQLYQPFVYQPGMQDEKGKEIPICPECQGLGYRQLTGLYELLILNDEFRKAALQTPRLDQLTALARSQGHVSLREEGILLIARGVTSLEELQRVLNK